MRKSEKGNNLKQYLCSYHWSNQNHNGFGNYTFTTPNKIDFKFIKELIIKIEKGFDYNVTIIIVNIISLGDL